MLGALEVFKAQPFSFPEKYLNFKGTFLLCTIMLPGCETVLYQICVFLLLSW